VFGWQNKSTWGKVFVYCTKGTEKDEWVKYIKYIYINQNYNIHAHDNDYKNIITHQGITEIDLIKICNEKINELSILFCHNQKKTLIGGGYRKI